MSEQRSATHTWRRRVLALGLGVALACGLAEVGLRVGGYDRTYANPLQSFHEADPVVGYRGKPNFRGRFRRPSFDVLIAHDPQGFRKHEHQRPRVDGDRQVFALGDSFTWGWGVDQGEVFTDQMNTLLPGHQVFNVGLNASGTVQQFALFERHVQPRLAPGDTVVIAFCANDYADNVDTDDDALHVIERDGKLVTVPPRAFGARLKDVLKDRSRLFNLISFWVNLTKRKWRTRGAVARAVAQGTSTPAPPLADDSLEVRVVTETLSRFQRACATAKVRLLLVDIGKDPNLAAIAKDVGADLLTLLPVFEAAVARGRLTTWHLRYDPHWNAEGHRVAAEAIAAEVLLGLNDQR